MTILAALRQIDSTVVERHKAIAGVSKLVHQKVPREGWRSRTPTVIAASAAEPIQDEDAGVFPATLQDNGESHPPPLSSRTPHEMCLPQP